VVTKCLVCRHWTFCPEARFGKLSEWIPRIKYYRDGPVLGRAWLRDSGLCLELSEFVALTQPAVKG